VWLVTEATVVVVCFAKAQEQFGSFKQPQGQFVSNHQQSHKVTRVEALPRRNGKKLYGYEGHIARKCVIRVVCVKLGKGMQSNTTVSYEVYLMTVVETVVVCNYCYCLV